MELKFEYVGKEIEFKITRRKRKTISIKIEENGDVIVSAPLKVSKEYILQVVKNKASWITKTQNEIIKRSSKKIIREIVEGSTFMYLGQEYPLHLIFNENRKNINVALSGNLNKKCDEEALNDYSNYNISANSKTNTEKELVEIERIIINTNTMDVEKIKLALEKWYRSETLNIVTKRINYYADNFKDKVTSIRVKEQKRRWASCTGKNAILFNWRCSMARADVLDYIVVHEMCHMDHRNHSKNFWNRVEEIMPDYRERHQWLKLNGMNLYH